MDEPQFEDIRGLFTHDGRLLAVWSEPDDDPKPHDLWDFYMVCRGDAAYVVPIKGVPLSLTKRWPLVIRRMGEQYEWAIVAQAFVEKADARRVVSSGAGASR